ncbi:MAG: hypothetical protein ABI337_08505 [Nitrososphaera sp.]
MVNIIGQHTSTQNSQNWYLTGIAHELGYGVVCWATGGKIYWPWFFLIYAL